MAKVVVLGLTGEDGLWQVDLDAGTVVPMEESADALKASSSTYKGVDYAVSVSTAGEGASGLFESATGLFES